MQGMDGSKERMIGFVIGLSKFAKSLNPDFLIIPQNAEILLEDPDYLAAIDGIEGKAFITWKVKKIMI